LEQHTVIAKKKRIRYGTFPPAAPTIELAWAKCRDAHSGLTAAERAQRVILTRAWQTVMVSALDAFDAARRSRRGPAPVYSAHELEAVLLFQRVLGETTVKNGREKFAGDLHTDAPKMFGLDHSRWRPRRGLRRRTAGIPSGATLCRYRHQITDEVRNEACAALLAFSRRELYARLAAHDRILYVDGTKLEAHFTAPKRDAKTKDIVNASKITAHHAGYVPKSTHPDKAGHGWMLVSLLTEDGIPLAHEVAKLPDYETDVPIIVFDAFGEHARPNLTEPHAVRVLSGDAAYADPNLRLAARRHGLIENAHTVSHANRPSSIKNTDKYDGMTIVN
jgi:hypothetical protein